MIVLGAEFGRVKSASLLASRLLKARLLLSAKGEVKAGDERVTIKQVKMAIFANALVAAALSNLRLRRGLLVTSAFTCSEPPASSTPRGSMWWPSPCLILAD